MPLPTNAQINAGFESRTLTAAEATEILALRQICFTAAKDIRDIANDGPFLRRAIRDIQRAFSHAKLSVLQDQEPT